MRHYVLKGKLPVAEPDLMTWARWFEKADRVVGRTEVGESSVSTVFLGLDHGFVSDPRQPPTLFETLVFGGPLDGETARYITWDEAETGHREMVERVRSAGRSEVGE